MPPPLLLHAGFDGLDMAYSVTLPADLHRALAQAKTEAVEARRAVALTYGGQTFLVGDRGGAGGYAYAVDTGVMGANWWFKEPGTGDRWGARASSRALPLATKGIEAVKAELDQFLIALGMSFTMIDCRLSRIDYAIDFLLPEFEIIPENFVTHSKRSKTIDGNYSANYRGDRINGIRIGKMPNSQVAIYDKRREVIDKKKFYWWEIWKVNAEKAGIQISNKSPIWRFEYRAGKNFIDKTYLRKTWEAFAAIPSLVFEKIVAQTRLVDPTGDSNRTRWPNIPEWDACQAVIDKISVSQSADVDAQKIADQLRIEYLRTLEKQTVGLIVSQACAYGLGVADMPSMFEQVRLDVDEALAMKGEEADGALARRAAEILTRFSC